MRNKSFGEFVDKKKRDGLKQLGLIQKLLEKNGMKVENFLDPDGKDEPYIYCRNPNPNGSFDGIRIYKIGEQFAFRIQKENKTHPYGSAYPLDIEEMFHDFLSDDGADKKRAGVRVIESVGKEIRKFFERSVEAERDNQRSAGGDRESSGNVLIRNTGTDYSAMIYSKS